MKNLENLKITPFTNDEVMKLIKLYQFKGKEFYYADVMKSDIESIIRQTIENECYQIVKLLNLKLTENRQNLIIRKNAVPKNSEEQLLANFKLVFSNIQADPQSFEFVSNEVYFLVKKLFKNVKDVTFTSYKVEVQRNLLLEQEARNTRDILNKLLQKYESLSVSGQHEISYIITNFYIDFINMNIFNSSNDIIGLLLLYILLIKENFNVFKYTSFIELINLHKGEFDNCVLEANYNYNEGFSKSAPLQKLIIDMMLEGYNKVESITRDYKFDGNLNKTDNLENTIYSLPQVFTKEDLRLRHPYTSESTINRTLQRLRDENIIRPNGVGRSATWIRIVEREKFDSNMKQINLFDFGIEE